MEIVKFTDELDGVETSMRIRRLGWAGVEIECDGKTLVIDCIQDTSPLLPLRSPNELFLPPSRPGATAVALVTHLHADHADPDAIAAALGDNAPVFRPEPAAGDKDFELTAHAETRFSKHKLAIEVLGVWEERNVGPFRIISVPAVDGFGDPQHSWVVECGRHRIIHTGDTLFHGYWWRIARRFAPFDVAFLPVNGPLVEFPHLQPPSPLPAVMIPEEAAIAAHLLQARSVVPIHYGSLHKPPVYVETPHPAERLREKATDLGIRALIHEPGTWFEPD